MLIFFGEEQVNIVKQSKPILYKANRFVFLHSLQMISMVDFYNHRMERIDDFYNHFIQSHKLARVNYPDRLNECWARKGQRQVSFKLLGG